MTAALDPESARLQAWARAVAESDLGSAREAAAARLSGLTEFLAALDREKSSRAATLANLQAAGIDPKAATVSDWFRAVHAVPDDGRPAAERLTKVWFRACCTRDPDAAMQATRTSIEEETLFLAAIDREKRIRAEVARICPGDITQSAPRIQAASARIRAEVTIDAQDGVANKHAPELS
jgi:hypothetical protein